MNSLKRHLATTIAATAAFLANPALAAQDETPPAQQAEAPSAASPAPALWQVSDEDTTIYLFGTIHALPTGVDWYTPAIENALSSSESIVTEIKLDGATQARVQQLTMELGMLPPEATLRSLLSEDDLATYEAALGKLGVPGAALDRFEPWLAALSVTMIPLMQQGYNPDSGVDKALIKKVDGKSQEALETPEFQIGVFDGMSQEAQIAFLMEASNGVDDIKRMVDQMVEYWLQGDADTLAAFLNDNMQNPTLAEAILYSRNENWAEWIDDRMDEPGTVFVAVGAGHLAGTKSVQDYLERRDIKVIRVQ